MVVSSLFMSRNLKEEYEYRGLSLRDSCKGSFKSAFKTLVKSFGILRAPVFKASFEGG